MLRDLADGDPFQRNVLVLSEARVVCPLSSSSPFLLGWNAATRRRQFRDGLTDLRCHK